MSVEKGVVTLYTNDKGKKGLDFVH